MLSPFAPDALTEHAREYERDNPERETLLLAATGAATVLGTGHSATRAFARAAATMTKVDVWHARLAHKTLRLDQRGPSPRRWKTEAPHVTRPTDQRRPAPAELFLGATGQTICYHVYDGSYCDIGGVHELPSR